MRRTQRGGAASRPATVIGRSPGLACNIGTISLSQILCQRIGPSPPARRPLLGRHPGIGIEPRAGAGAEASLGRGGLAGVGSTEVHVQLRLLIGDVSAGHRGISSGELRAPPFRHASRSCRPAPRRGPRRRRGQPTVGLRPTSGRPRRHPSRLTLTSILIVAEHDPVAGEIERILGHH